VQYRRVTDGLTDTEPKTCHASIASRSENGAFQQLELGNVRNNRFNYFAEFSAYCETV